MKADVDPTLARQLDAARATEPVEAVLMLRDGAPQGDSAAALMQQASDEDADAEMNYMPRIGALVVRAQSHVIRLLISQPTVEVASANQRAEGYYL
ncbi:hypothetical protein SE17_05510 [Kouleothrix aurantiaca]|jgi:hypothetical protein|uniref:Uncharacterized protein n=1 Tax=Kouleothrix aurantiaca TaxID=186479 RepID=A0A0P9D509_9CHLR|nr:hypothetical protein SE17_05510 [Kouleothrix aurantiaca]